VTRQDFWQLIIRLAAPVERGGEGVAVLVSTPYMDEAARCKRVGFMHGGRLLLEGAPAALRSRLEGGILELRGRPLPLLRSLASADPGVLDAQMFGDRLHLHITPVQAAEVQGRLAEAVSAAGGEIAGLRLIPPQLEDLFIALLREAA
jgi:ABC-2 type transport system ATP-binding protein